MDNTINYARFSEYLTKLTEKTVNLIKTTGNQGLLEGLMQELKNSSDRKELRIAFVGQYSSGKSTIISALTGNKSIKIDANVATDTVSIYKWNNIILMDTPGILAGKVEKHDERTKEALKECDLIFYVLTSQLFDDVIFKNFLDLAYSQHLADKMFLVINKMGMEDGEYNELRQNYLETLSKTFSAKGYDISSFPIAFIDASDYIEGVDSNDDEFVEVSQFVPFIGQLNNFVSKHGLIKKQFDTPIRILQSYLKNIALSQIDEHLVEFYKQYETKLSQSQRDMRRSVTEVLNSLDSSAMNEVVSLASLIGSDDQMSWEQKQKNLDNKLTKYIDDTSKRIDQTITENYLALQNEMNEFAQKDALVKYEDYLDAKINSPQISIQEKTNLNKQKTALKFLKNAGEGVSKFAPGVNDFFGGISQASGSQLHEIVKGVGHFFGKSFKPWEAVRWASNIAKFAKFGVPVVTAGIDIWFQFRESDKEEKRMQQIKDSKDQFITGYQSAVNNIKEQFTNYMQQVLENYNLKRNEINQSKDELIKASEQNQKLQKSIEALEGEYVDFIEIIDNE